MSINNKLAVGGTVVVLGIAALVVATPREPVEPPVAHAEAAAPSPTAAKVTTSTAASDTRDEAAGILQGWDSSFQSPPIVFYDDELVVEGETFDADTAAWFDGKIYIDTDTFDYGNKTANVRYTVGHEIGHGWEEHYDPYYPVGKKSELYADCMAGAIGAAAGWDVDAMKDYARYDLGDDKIHGDGDDRYKAMTTGETGGYIACERNH